MMHPGGTFLPPVWEPKPRCPTCHSNLVMVKFDAPLVKAELPFCEKCRCYFNLEINLK